MSEILKLGSNENILGPSPLAMAAIQAAADAVHHYPANHEARLIERLAAYVGGNLTDAHFSTGNGSVDVLRHIAAAFIRPGVQVLMPAQTFGVYAALTAKYGGESVTVPLQNWRIDLAGLLAAVTPATRLIFLCNPNNPTGSYFSHAELGSFLARLPAGIITVVDEAYMEFATAPDFPRMADFVGAGFPLIVTRTFSKLFGLASLRIGYAFGAPELMNQVRSEKLPFNSGIVPLLAAAAALGDHEHRERTLDMVVQGRRYFRAALAELGLTVIPSEAFYVLLTDLPRPPRSVSRCWPGVSISVMVRPLPYRTKSGSPLVVRKIMNELSPN